MRYLVGDAGHIQRLYLAVKTASEYQVENLQTLCEIYLRKFRGLTVEGSKKRGLLKSTWRSAEPHFSLARELDLLEWRDRERWKTTFGAGRTFLSLWNDKSPPQALLLHQLLTYDRTFLLPFLVRLIEADYDFAVGRYLGLQSYVKEVWQELWQSYGQELRSKEPPLPENPKDRTLLHHAAARIRFLNKMEGLRLSMDKLIRLTHEFSGFEDSQNMPADSFFRIGAAVSGRRPSQLNGTDLSERILRAFSTLQRAGHASGHGIYLFVNETSLPQQAVDWEAFTEHVRKERPFSTRASFRRDDFLITVESQTEIAREQR
jgi:hypothetical protein